ncbi:hypothetical protein ACFVYA_48975, partial [Amycolatopsis sp. NPDC058278]|uniref:hypothetical protein n=1 Tax=Amycolatopsis sp. NPDC058278 TaxID=3346417 RepID=UPI0036DDBA1E
IDLTWPTEPTEGTRVPSVGIVGDHRERTRRIEDDHADRVLRRTAARRALGAASPAVRSAALAVVQVLSDHRQKVEHLQEKAVSAQKKQGR